MPLSEEYATREHKIPKKSERLMLGTGIILALFIGIGLGVVLHNPLGIGMLTGFVAKDGSCIEENDILIAEQKAYIEQHESTSKLQEKIDSLREKIDATWYHFQSASSNSKEDLTLLQDYYREKTLLEKDLFSMKQDLYTAKNKLSQAQDNIKGCIEKVHASATSSSLAKVASEAISINSESLQSSLVEKIKESPQSTISPKASPTACKVPGAIKACPSITKNGKTCRAYQECGEDLHLNTCIVNEATCQ